MSLNIISVSLQLCVGPYAGGQSFKFKFNQKSFHFPGFKRKGSNGLNLMDQCTLGSDIAFPRYMVRGWGGKIDHAYFRKPQPRPLKVL